MSHDVVERLLNSFTLLENAIQGACETLASREEVPTEILKRIESYNALLVKQRDIAKELASSVDSSDWNSVAQKIRLINGLLDLIRQDAREIVKSLNALDEEGTTPETLVN